MRPIVLAFFTAIALLVVPSAPTSAAMPTDTFGSRLHNQTNQARRTHDIRKLKPGRCLQRFAQRQARRMAKQQRLYHQNLGVVLHRCHARRVGENVAYGYSTPRANTRAWMNSPGHRRNILDRRFTRMGIGVAVDRHGRTWTAQVFGRPL